MFIRIMNICYYHVQRGSQEWASADYEGVGQIFWSIRTPEPYYAILQ